MTILFHSSDLFSSTQSVLLCLIPFFLSCKCVALCSALQILSILCCFILFSFFQLELFWSTAACCVLFYSVLVFCGLLSVIQLSLLSYLFTYTMLFSSSHIIVVMPHNIKIASLIWFILQWYGPGNHLSTRTQISSSPSASPLNWRTCRVSMWACLISSSESSVSLLRVTTGPIFRHVIGWHIYQADTNLNDWLNQKGYNFMLLKVFSQVHLVCFVWNLFQFYIAFYIAAFLASNTVYFVYYFSIFMSML